MSYLVIARKYRPQSFADVVGQEHITTTITRAIEKGRLAHAYLFAGPRGVGKTTTARILAKSVNCDKGPTTEPCNNCSACREITEGVHLDVIEIDGASNRGIDDVRELRERVRYAPARGRHKVYIIDEVHMLTTEAFNALLKTLEEPPEHTLFVFATTESHKVPSTILSRCQRFDFRLIPLSDIIKHLQWICSEEGVRVTDEALALIARRAAGCLRDSQSMLDQLIAFGSEAEETELEEAMVEKLLGVVRDEVYLRIGIALLVGKLGEALADLRDLLNRGYDLGEVTRGFIAYLGSIILARLETEGISAQRGASAELSGRLAEELRDVSPDDILRASDILTTTEREMNRSTQPELLIELAFVKIARMGKTVEIDRIMTRLEELAAGAPGGSVHLEAEPEQPQSALFQSPPEAVQPAPSQASRGEPTADAIDNSGGPTRRETPSNDRPVDTGKNAEPGPTTDAKPEDADRPAARENIDLEFIRGGWHDFIDKINHHRGSVGACLEIAELLSFDNGLLVLGFAPENHFHRERVQEHTVREMVEKAATDFFGHPLRIKCTTHQTAGEATGPTGKSENTGRSDNFDREPIINKSIDLLGLERLPGG